MAVKKELIEIKNQIISNLKEDPKEEKKIPIEKFTSSEKPIVESKWERWIQNLVRLASIILFTLMMTRINNFSEELSQLIVYSFLVTFILGIVLVYFQISFLNSQRNKSTNLGGVLSLFGLGLTPVMIIFPKMSITFPIFIFGLVLISIGLFAEVTRIDEPLLFWLKTEFRKIIQYSITIIGFILLIWGFFWYFIWPQEIVGLLGVFFGIFIVYFTWFNHFNNLLLNVVKKILNFLKNTWNGIVNFIVNYKWQITQFTLSFIGISSIAIGFLIFVTPNKQSIGLNIMVLGLSFLFITWIKTLVRFLKEVYNILVKTWKAFVYSIRNFIQFVKIHRWQITQFVLTIFGILLIWGGFLYYSFNNIASSVLVVAGILSIITAWHVNLWQFFNNAMSAFVWTGKTFVQFVIIHKKEITQYILTFSGILLISIGYLYYSTLKNLGLGMVGLGILFLIIAWHEFLWQFLKDAVNVLIMVGKTSVQFLKNTWKDFEKFVKTYFWKILQYTTTCVCIILIIFGPTLFNLFISPLDSFLSKEKPWVILTPTRILGILFLYLAWHIPINAFVMLSRKTILQFLKDTKEAVIRTGKSFVHFLKTYRWKIAQYATTLVCIILLFLGNFLYTGIINQAEPFIAFLTITQLFSIILLYITWHIPINAFVVLSGKTILQFLKDTKEAVIRKGKSIVLFLKTYRWNIIQYTTTVVSIVLLFFGNRLYNGLFKQPEPLIVLLTVTQILSIILLYLAWHIPINAFVVLSGKTILRFLQETKEAAIRTWKSFIQFLKTYRWKIAQYTTTVVSLIFLFLGNYLYTRLMNQSEPLIGFFSFTQIFSVILLILAWHKPIIGFIKQIWTKFLQFIIYSWKAMGEFRIATWAFLKRITNQIINSIIPIIGGLISVVAISYCIFVIIYTIIPPFGSSLDTFIVQYILGVAFIASIIQGSAYEGFLIGEFAQTEPIFNFIFSGIIILVAIIVILFILRSKEQLKLQSIFKGEK